MEVSGQPQVPIALTPGKSSDTHRTGKLVSPRASLDVLEKRKSFCPGWDSIPGPPSPCRVAYVLLRIIKSQCALRSVIPVC